MKSLIPENASPSPSSFRLKEALREYLCKKHILAVSTPVPPKCSRGRVYRNSSGGCSRQAGTLKKTNGTSLALVK